MTGATQIPASILVVDDTPTNVGVLLQVLGREGFKVLVARDGESAIEQARYARPDLVLLDVMMPGLDGFETCHRLKQDPTLAGIPVIFMTALADVEDKVRGFAVGGADYVVKPFQHEEVVARVRMHLALRALQQRLSSVNAELEDRVADRTRELETALAEVERLKVRLQYENRYLKQEISESGSFDEIVGASAVLKEVLRKVDMVAATTTSVLIRGETGTGKELIARAIHRRSPRSERALVKLNCSAISAGLVESELFGHIKGAFTGASDRRVGRFELADGGTLFLDEVSELPLETQTKLLRVLQEGEFEPVGSSKTQKVDVRIVAACNRDLARDVEEGRFRSDLYYRLNVFPIDVPPLRARSEDIPVLARHFMDRFARKLGRRFTDIDGVSLERLRAHSWPGNIRDLQNAIERAAILCVGPTLRIDWPLETAASCFDRVAATAESTHDSMLSNKSAIAGRSLAGDGLGTLEEIERQHVIAVLRQTHGVIEGPKGAARLLDLKPSTARFRMRKLGIRGEDYRN
jgi:DNA-binding NtrC family response regulator